MVLVAASAGRDGCAGRVRKAGGIATAWGDEMADDFVALYEQHYPRLVRALELGGLRRATAEDVAQEAFARTFGRWRRVRAGPSPAGYVFTVAFRLSRRSWRGREVLVADPASAGGAASPSGSGTDDPVAAEATLRAGVEAVLGAMPPGRRACAVLCLVAEMSPKQAGRALGIASSTVRKQLDRARADLRAGLGMDPARVTS